MDSHSLHIAIHTPAMAAPSGSDGHCRFVFVNQYRLLDRHIGANPSNHTQAIRQIPLSILTGLTRARTNLRLEIGAGGKKCRRRINRREEIREGRSERRRGREEEEGKYYQWEGR